MGRLDVVTVSGWFGILLPCDYFRKGSLALVRREVSLVKKESSEVVQAGVEDVGS